MDIAFGACQGVVLGGVFPGIIIIYKITVVRTLFPIIFVSIAVGRIDLGAFCIIKFFLRRYFACVRFRMVHEIFP